jgi:LuxR family transcriptional regulator, maltose regulon positive regulatory protein
LLPLLADHLSFTEISEALGLERSTVDSQALSIYRKLGVSPLSDAIDLFAGPPGS